MVSFIVIFTSRGLIKKCREKWIPSSVGREVVVPRTWYVMMHRDAVHGRSSSQQQPNVEVPSYTHGAKFDSTPERLAMFCTPSLHICVNSLGNPSCVPLHLPIDDPVPLDRSTRFNYGGSGDPLRDAEALVSFIKMEDGLLSKDQVRQVTSCSACALALWR